MLNSNSDHKTQDAPSPLSQGRIPSLDGLRAVSILLVVVSHLSMASDNPLPGRVWWYHNGAIGVDVFFAISGFLITTLLLRERDRSGKISIRGFYGRRGLRILPPFYAYLMVLAALNCFGYFRPTHLVYRDWVASLTYTANFVTSALSQPLRHIWSLSVEEHFYLIWPLLIALLGVRRASKAALICLLAEPIIRWCTFHFGGHRFDIDYVTFTRLDAIAAGCLMAIAARYPTPQSPLARLDARPVASFFTALAVLFLSLFVLSHSGKYGILFGPLVNALAICVMIWTACRFPETSFGRVLNFAPLAWLGRISYSLYLWHPLFINPINGQHWACRFPQNLVLALMAAVASYYLIEQPFLSLKKQPKQNQPILMANDTSPLALAC